MPAGRPRKPVERATVVAINGRTPGGRELATVAPSAVQGTAAPAPSIPLGERGMVEWSKIWQAGYWLKPDQDYHWIEIIASAYDEIETYRAKVAEDGLTVEGYNGQTVAHPLIKEIRAAQSVITKALSTLGFSPTDRARLNLAEVKAASALDQFMERRANGKQRSSADWD